MDESVFHRIYEEYHQDVYRFLIYLTKDRTLSEDLLHEVYVRVLKSFGSFQGKSSERTWLFSIARNVAFDHFRRASVRRKRTDESYDWETEQPADRGPTPEEAAVHGDEMVRLFGVLDACTEDQRMVLIMRFLQELSIAETAEVLGWTEAKVKTTQHRAVKKARELLEKSDGQGGGGR
ncbi:RNA polymerase sigma factor sigX [Bhargavaea cecembensis DSE10]|uniref:RNA polymerase sigma factor sigX n=1 Tax=Bhargavaea cecembensis DSE10 TaxID=1235279 RepID=M7P0K0_9BACL|nr:RNA polymerase sigma factor SigX [Bhargavaea cecembensis]EMR07435.1 RNA polymerase sigma factor sigX [Bhargavaea cecembensis DSE10]